MTEEQKAYHRKWYAEHKAEVNKRYNAMYQRKKRQISERRKELRGTVRRKVSRLDRPVIITGTSSGIGLATAKKFLEQGFTVIGIDVKSSAIPLDSAITRPTTEQPCRSYTHHIADVSKPETLPNIKNAAIIINNAGTIDEDKAVAVNLEGYINVAEKYAFQPNIRCVVNVGSISGHVGLDTPKYAAAQGGRLAYTKNLAIRLGNQYKARVNSISPGAVLSGLEPHLYEHTDLVQAVANENLLKKWIDPEEIAEWIYFLAVVDKSMTGQDILIDNGEVANYNFVTAGER